MISNILNYVEIEPDDNDKGMKWGKEKKGNWIKLGKTKLPFNRSYICSPLAATKKKDMYYSFGLSPLIMLWQSAEGKADQTS